MWPWIKRWRDWAMHDLWPLHRVNCRPQALHFSYEKAGLTLPDQPIPWNAESVLVEAQVNRLKPDQRRKGDFQLRLGRRPPLMHGKPFRSDRGVSLSSRLPVPPSHPGGLVIEALPTVWCHNSLSHLILPGTIRVNRLALPAGGWYESCMEIG